MELKKKVIIMSSLLVALSIVGNASADVKLTPKPQLQHKPQLNFKPSIAHQLQILPEIKNVKHSCTGGSMSSARLLVTATVLNKNSKTLTYNPMFIGMKAGACLEENSDHCAGQPSDYICAPKCIKQAPPIPITIKGKSVTVPAKGNKTFSILAPTHLYLAGTRVVIGGVKAMVLPVPISQCVL